mgnify:CR=1 FL=1
MDKETLKELLRDSLDVQMWTEYDPIGDEYELHTRILFDGETISQDYITLASI